MDLNARKPRGSDIDWFNPYGNYVTYFIDCTESLNVVDSSCNHQKTSSTFEVGPTMCVSFANEGKTQVRWVVAIGQKTQRWTSANNIPPKRSFIMYQTQMKWLWNPCI